MQSTLPVHEDERFSTCSGFGVRAALPLILIAVLASCQENEGSPKGVDAAGDFDAQDAGEEDAGDVDGSVLMDGSLPREDGGEVTDSGLLDGGVSDTGDAGTGPEFEVISELRVSSDGPEGVGTYDRFYDVLGPNCLEAPDLYKNNHPGEPHIVEMEGGPTGNFFRFSIHRDLDRDRDQYPAIDDRQRNEAKAYDQSDSEALGLEGDTTRYLFYLMIPDAFPLTSRFTHFMQVKPVSGDDQQPLLTITGTYRAGEPEIQLRYVANGSGPIDYIARAPFAAVTGRWVEVDMILTHADDGFLHVDVRELDGESIFSGHREGIDLFRVGADFNRPKWGIYRGLEIESLPNEMDSVDFADFSIQKISLR